MLLLVHLLLVTFSSVNQQVESLLLSKTDKDDIIPTHLQSLLRKNCSDIEEKDFPRITVQHGDDYFNSSFNLEEASETSADHNGFRFSITCVSNYPIDWIVNYFDNGHGNGKTTGLHLQVFRRFQEFYDPSTYKFIITSKMRYKNNLGFKNFSFSCRSMHRPHCLQRRLSTTALLNGAFWDKSGIRFNIMTGSDSWGSKSNKDTKIEGPFTSLPDHTLYPMSPCNYTVYFRNLGWNSFGLSCKFKDGSPGMVKVIYQCPNAISCISYHYQHLDFSKFESCVKPLVEVGNASCVASSTCQEKPFRLLSQGFLTCTTNSPVLNNEEASQPYHHYTDEQLLFFFTSIPQQSQESSSQLYFSMDQVQPGEMISLSQIPSKVSVGDQITVVCNTSSYYFAGGTRLALQYSGSDLLYFLKATLVSNGISDNSPGNVFEANIPITTENIVRVYCFAPVWNSFAWVNKSHPINVQDKSPSHIVIAVSITLLATTVLFGILFALCWIKILRKRLSSFGKLLSPQEIEEFRRYQNTGMEDSPTAEMLKYPQNDYEFIHQGISASYNTSLEIKREQLLLDETAVLGKGHFGIVLKGVLKDEKTNQRKDVAVKTLKTKTDVGALKSLLSELKIMASVGKHTNVVNVVAACTKRMEKGEVFVAVEYCANGNLQLFLRDHRGTFKNQLQRDIIIVETPYSIRRSVSDNLITTLDLIKWAWEISKGMEFLSSKKIIHGDLATRNILLTATNVAKVSDFGLSRQLVDYYYVKEETVGPMPWKWMAIESLRDMKFSIQSDIWSCGVTLWELFTLADVPYYGCSWSAEFVHTLVSGHRLGRPQYATSEMYDLMRECWKEDPNKRPSFSAIKMFFEDILTQCTCQDYMQLDLDLPTKCSTIQIHDANSPLLTLTPTIDVSDYDIEDDVFEQ